MEGWRGGGVEGWRDGGMEGWRDRGTGGTDGRRDGRKGREMGRDGMGISYIFESLQSFYIFVRLLFYHHLQIFFFWYLWQRYRQIFKYE
jgi:hypothetical protein